MREITIDGLARRLEQFLTAASRRNALKYAAAEVSRQAQSGAVSKGGRSFWRSVADSVSFQPDGPDGYVVGASHVAAAQKQFGGEISAPGKGAGSLHARMLTIPVGIARDRRWNAGRAAQAGFRLFRVKNLLMGTDGGNAIPLFVLKKSVTQAPDPWFPQGTALERAVDRGIRLYLERMRRLNA